MEEFMVVWLIALTIAMTYGFVLIVGAQKNVNLLTIALGKLVDKFQNQ